MKRAEQHEPFKSGQISVYLLRRPLQCESHCVWGAFMATSHYAPVCALCDNPHCSAVSWINTWSVCCFFWSCCGGVSDTVRQSVGSVCSTGEHATHLLHTEMLTCSSLKALSLKSVYRWQSTVFSFFVVGFVGFVKVKVWFHKSHQRQFNSRYLITF